MALIFTETIMNALAQILFRKPAKRVIHRECRQKLGLYHYHAQHRQQKLYLRSYFTVAIVKMRQHKRTAMNSQMKDNDNISLIHC